MNRIKQLRLEANINQDVLAKLLGLEIAGISKLETGRVPLKDEYILKLADYFNCSTDYLLGKSDIRNYSDIKRLNVQDFAVNNSNYDNNKYDISKLNVPANTLGMIKFQESMKKIQEFQNADLSEKDATDIANLLDAIVPFIDKKTGKKDEK